MVYTQTQYDRRVFLRVAGAGTIGAGAILATDGLTGLLAQEAKSKTKELTELLENKDVFPKPRGTFELYEPRIHPLPDGATLPKLPKNQIYGLETSIINARFELPNFKNVGIEYNPRETVQRLGVYDGRFNLVRDMNITIRKNLGEAIFNLYVDELDFVMANNVQIPVTAHTVFNKKDLDDKPGKYNIRKEAGPSIPEHFRRISASMDEATATAKYNEIIDLVLQEARNRVELTNRR